MIVFVLFFFYCFCFINKKKTKKNNKSKNKNKEKNVKNVGFKRDNEILISFLLSNYFQIII